MLLLHGAVNMFLDDRWSLGSFLFSLGVSIKTNLLLFSPAILIVYLLNLGLKKTFLQLAICASLQLLLALPFLFHAPIPYFIATFPFFQVFGQSESVNWGFVPQYVFESSWFSLSLTFAHISTLLFCSFCGLKFLLKRKEHLQIPDTNIYSKIKRKLYSVQKNYKTNIRKLTKSEITNQIVFTLFFTNFVGVCFSRSLHSQYYCW